MVPSDRLKYVQILMHQELETCLSKCQVNTPQHLYDAIHYALLLPGKRLRAFLVFATAQLFDIAERDVLPIAISIEMMHCYSLIHDDLPCMDNSPLRRGQPTLHIKFDEATALLAGSALLAMAIDVMNTAHNFTYEQRVQLVSMLIKSSGMQGMMGGQMLDILGETQQYTVDQIQHMQYLKTGCLIKFSVLAPIICSDNAQSHLPILTDYANNLGLAYQLADDFADIESIQDVVGKPVSQDKVMNKSTLLSVLGIAAARIELASLIRNIEDSLQIFGNKASLLLWVAQRLVNR